MAIYFPLDKEAVDWPFHLYCGFLYDDTKMIHIGDIMEAMEVDK